MGKLVPISRDGKICEQCNGFCQFIDCKVRPASAEWYCEKCHRSYPVYQEVPDKPRPAA